MGDRAAEPRGLGAGWRRFDSTGGRAGHTARGSSGRGRTPVRQRRAIALPAGTPLGRSAAAGSQRPRRGSSGDRNRIRSGDALAHAEEIPTKVSADTAYQNAIKNSDKQNARIEHDRALSRVMVELLADHTELFKQFSDNPSFKGWLGDTIFNLTYRKKEKTDEINP